MTNEDRKEMLVWMKRCIILTLIIAVEILVGVIIFFIKINHIK